MCVVDEEDNETLLLHRISSDDIYRKQEGFSFFSCKLLSVSSMNLFCNVYLRYFKFLVGLDVGLYRLLKY